MVSVPANDSASPFRVVAVGTSAGGLKVLQALLLALPQPFPWPIALVQHLHSAVPTHLPEILSHCNQWSVKLADTGDRLEPNLLYIAPPDHHLMVQPDFTLALSEQPKVHFSRPAIDVLFQSVAQVCGEAAIAIILTGSNADGAAGIQAVKAAGGLTLAQSPATAEAERMPQAAIATGAVDYVLEIAAIADKLVELAQKG